MSSTTGSIGLLPACSRRPFKLRLTAAGLNELGLQHVRQGSKPPMLESRARFSETTNTKRSYMRRCFRVLVDPERKALLLRRTPTAFTRDSSLAKGLVICLIGLLGHGLSLLQER